MKKEMATNLLMLLSVLLIAGYLFYLGGSIFGPGLYSDSKFYEVNYSEDQVIKKLSDFKKNNPEFKVPLECDLTDGRADSSDLTYAIYYYYPLENQILYTWVRKINKRKTRIAFVSVNEGKKLGNWKSINRDFGSTENTIHKKKFEGLILEKSGLLVR